jgi:hypothetical protein
MIYKNLKPSSPKAQGFILLESLIALIIVSLAMIPMMKWFWSPDVRAYERADVDQLLYLELYQNLYDPDFLDHTIHTTTGHGAPILIELKWTHQNFEHCLSAKALKNNAPLSELVSCRYAS